MTYEKALAELETIARKMESGGYDIDQLADQLKRAQGLIKLCRDKLTKTDAEIKKILDAEE
ncbi:MAG: exodeoxyribonuclease VII small subunit [Prevotellaceae bacterium]|nr:exodeoxyribonuclease VII small subunit [Prevotellaceae bacterium]